MGGGVGEGKGVEIHEVLSSFGWSFDQNLILDLIDDSLKID
jgi:hypothetical protein